MRYCFNCNRVTPGEPLFCNACGRSYRVKLCPRLHANPRNAEVCSQCGSRDISTPQPRVPFWVPVLQFFLSLIPGLVLGLVSVALVVLLLKAIFQSPDMLFATVMLAIAVGVLWWIWAKVPAWFRRAVHRMLTRRRNGQPPNGSH
jgi:RNA polymerase subunit RPABC4/transcription elongation factor Spt4